MYRRSPRYNTVGALYKGPKFKRVLSFVGAVSLFLSAVRVLVLFSEAYSLVSAERASDSELLRICKDQEQTAISSTKLRGACLQARTDSAAPLVLKALLKAVGTLFSDFAELFSSPTRVVVLLLFVVSGLGAPVVGLLLKTFLAGLRVTSGPFKKDHGSDDDDSDDEHQQRQLTVVVGSGWREDGLSQSPSKHALYRRRSTGVPQIEEVDEATEGRFARI